MVMRADIWGNALDDVFDTEIRQPHQPGRPLRILAIPSPAGVPLTQEICQSLADLADHIVIACGRYEGIDSRVAAHYQGRDDVEVLEYSLGDYVLNGGEVAALALVEAVARLVPGVVGNPESLVEESHGAAGLLEYPNYTRPLSWRGETVPEVLTSGDHQKVARWRRDQALEKTARLRPDMISALTAADLDKKDRAKLGELGWFFVAKPGPADHPLRPTVDTNPGPEQAAEYSRLARETFPDACPPHLTLNVIEAYMEAHLSVESFESYMSDPQWIIVGVRIDNVLVAYSLTHIPADGESHDDEPRQWLGEKLDGPLMYLSKCYVERRYRGSGVSDFLLEATIEELHTHASGTAPYLWLGTHTNNWRARKFYTSHGFELAGKRTFMVGDEPNDDVVMVRGLDMAY